MPFLLQRITKEFYSSLWGVCCEFDISTLFYPFRCQIVLYIMLYSTAIIGILNYYIWPKGLSMNKFIAAPIESAANVCRTRVYRLMQTIVYWLYYWKAPFSWHWLTPSLQGLKRFEFDLNNLKNTKCVWIIILSNYATSATGVNLKWTKVIITAKYWWNIIVLIICIWRVQCVKLPSITLQREHSETLLVQSYYI